MIKAIKLILFITIAFSTLLSQSEDKTLKIFGYFQNEFEYQKGTAEIEDFDQNTFVLQQLNLFFQRDFSDDWTSFVNFEILNSFSSSRQWGAVNLEEAWIKYRASRQFNLKMGLQIPIFNNFNEIKNRTPLIPYIIRPLVYETAFSENIQVDEYAPQNAYLQAYGFIPSHDLKIDYAIYAGNTANISSLMELGQAGRSGTDTTSSVLIGARLGLRYGELKAGVSATRDIINYFSGAYDTLFQNTPPDKFKEVPRIRFGMDLSYNYNNFSFESEYIQVTYDFDVPNFNFDKYFYYATLGYYLTDPMFIYISYWVNEEYYPPFTIQSNKKSEELEVTVPNIGLAYNISDRIKAKLHYAYVGVHSGNQEIFKDRFFHFLSTAISVVF
jgi:hypothetical protein